MHVPMQLHVRSGYNNHPCYRVPRPYLRHKGRHGCRLVLVVCVTVGGDASDGLSRLGTRNLSITRGADHEVVRVSLGVESRLSALITSAEETAFCFFVS